MGQLCVRGMRGNGIFVLDKLTLRGAPGENDGVTSFNLPPPQGPAVPAVRVVGNEVQFGGPGTSVAGSSFFWSNGRFGQDLFYTAETVRWLAQDWGAQIVRAAMAVDNGNTALEEVGGYLTVPLDNKRNVQVLVNAAIENGIYVSSTTTPTRPSGTPRRPWSSSPRWPPFTVGTTMSSTRSTTSR